ncbi:MAG TPA: hypothetical protein QF700_11950 [Prochlorococcus sp.]|nr:hypothetical protein [Prochlorococcus sp.]
MPVLANQKLPRNLYVFAGAREDDREGPAKPRRLIRERRKWSNLAIKEAD